MSNAHALELEGRGTPADESDRTSSLVELVQQRPWAAVLGVAFAGFVLARIVRSLR